MATKALDFFMAIPKLCGAKDADRASWIIETIYNAELNGGTPFDRNPNDLVDPENRLYWAFAFRAADDNAKEYCKNLVKIIMYSHYLDEHGEKEYESLANEAYIAAKDIEASDTSASVSAVYSVMSADDALAASWNI